MTYWIGAAAAVVLAVLAALSGLINEYFFYAGT
jgi:hypothetical protein